MVKEYAWLTDRQFVDAVAVAMITPGPVVITTGFIGFLISGFWGAVVAALATFMPCYLLTVIPAPYFEKHGKHPGVLAFVDEVTLAPWTLGAASSLGWPRPWGADRDGPCCPGPPARAASSTTGRPTHTHLLAGATPVLALDMYEHAYQLDFGAKAGAYVDAYMAKSSGTRSTSAKALLSRRMRWHLASTQALRWPERQVRLTCDVRRTICKAHR